MAHPAGRDRWKRRLGGLLVAPVCLAAALLAFALVRGGSDYLFGVAVTVLAGAAFLWIGVSIFFPARVDPTCPECGSETVVRADPETTRGLRCEACGWDDPHASSWLQAEAEGPLEHVVLAERDRARRREGHD